MQNLSNTVVFLIKTNGNGKTFANSKAWNAGFPLIPSKETNIKHCSHIFFN